MSKNEDKNTRSPTGSETTSTRKVMHRQKQMDDSLYQEKYGEDFKLMWIVDEGGQLDKWIDVGAEPVKRESRNNKTFEGLTDRHSNPWVRVVAGTDAGGNTVYQYLLMLKHEIYDEVKIQPQKDRQGEIRTAMGLGATAGDEISSPSMKAQESNVAGVKTYVPVNMDGSAGFNEIRKR